METTTETLSVNGVVLNTLAYNVSSLAGRLRAPALRTENISVPSRHGTLRTRRKYYEEGQIILPLWVRGTDLEGENPDKILFYQNMDMLTKLFRPGSGLLEVVHTLPDSSARRAMAECTEAIDLTPKGSTLATFSVALTVPSVFWEDATPISQDLIWPQVGEVSSLAGMTAPLDDSVFTVHGPVTNVRVEATIDGSPLENPMWFKYSGTVALGQTLTIDCGKWTLTGGGGHIASYQNFSHQGAGRWMVLEAGNPEGGPELSITGSNTSAATFVNISARRKFLVG